MAEQSLELGHQAPSRCEHTTHPSQHLGVPSIHLFLHHPFPKPLGCPAIAHQLTPYPLVVLAPLLFHLTAWPSYQHIRWLNPSRTLSSSLSFPSSHFYHYPSERSDFLVPNWFIPRLQDNDYLPGSLPAAFPIPISCNFGQQRMLISLRDRTNLQSDVTTSLLPADTFCFPGCVIMSDHLRNHLS